MKYRYKLFRLTPLCLFTVFGLVGCQLDSEFGGGGPHSPVETNELDPLSDESLAGTHQLTIKTLHQVVEAMDQRTGIRAFLPSETFDASNPRMTGTYTELRLQIQNALTSLPTSPQASASSPSHYLTIFHLAYIFCRVLNKNPEARARFYEGTPFAGALAGPTATFTPENRGILINHLLDRFWGVRSFKSESRLEAEADLDDLLQFVQAGTAQNDFNTRLVMRAVCTAALGSAPIVLQ